MPTGSIGRRRRDRARRRRAALPAALLLALTLALVLLPGAPGVEAQVGATRPAGAISLVADRIEIDAEEGTVTAEGAVEVFQNGRILRASRIVYSEADGTIRATGPLELVDPDEGVLVAEEAALTADLVAGLVREARLLIAGELQIAAAEVRRSEGRYTTLFRTVASSCEVCPGEFVPTWAIRAERVIRDEDLRQIHFRNATLEVLGLPVAWLPYLRIPDVGVERATGFLVPELRRSDIYGLGLKLPYYIVLSPSADMTLTPFVTEKAGVLVEGEYRRRFANGGFDLSGVLLADDRLEGRTGRGALTAEGAFALGEAFGGGYRAEFEANLVSDDRFLEQFDYSSADRLTSFARLVRTGPQDRVELGGVAFQSLRPDEARGTVPVVLPELTWRRYWEDGPLGGRIGAELDALGLYRDDGRDVVRGGGGADWRRGWTLGPGVLASATAAVSGDAYSVSGAAPGEDGGYARLVPTLAAELRWPLLRPAADGAAHVIEPVASLAWSEAIGDDAPPNEDSQLPEFDETNLFALNRFPGRDRVETGLRAGLGLGYSYEAPGGVRLGAVAGRVLRLEPEDAFAEGTGLSGTASDWVGAVSLALAPGVLDGSLVAVGRARITSDLAVRRNEFGLAYDAERLGLGAAYVYLEADDTNPDLGPQPRSSEITLDGRWRFLPNWRVTGLWRYDLSADSSIRAAGSLTYGNECAEIDLSVSRRYTSSANVPPSTSIGFVVRLTGLGAGGSEAWPRRACNG